jgi:hypothetical protein
MFRAAELARIAKRVDRAAKEKREEAAALSSEDRLARVEKRNTRLRQGLRRLRR